MTLIGSDESTCHSNCGILVPGQVGFYSQGCRLDRKLGAERGPCDDAISDEDNISYCKSCLII